ncbi:Multidrug resistance-associated protein [Blattamonas nauphoetae]|uniref:Multidrug resistance-associated protein n=1 Tax=Blattamonas nauphoetae TaxID=2049346 RepID=A0ABQ9YAI4_9EUKA|nr:Multidrug resistance-associated protein [Blattamonas nauphoetae]
MEENRFPESQTEIIRTERSLDGTDLVVSKPRKNLEDSHNFFSTLFYCFYYPFICRCKPITNDDVYECGKKDKVSYSLSHSGQRWIQKQEDYLKARAEWDLSEHPPNEKPPKRPSIFTYIVFQVSKRSLIVTIIWFFVSNGLNLIMPLIMKLLLQDIASKDINPTFPFASGIVQILLPYIQGLADGVSSRLFYHRTLSVRGMLSAFIFDKTMKLNLNTQGEVDTGRLLSLITADTRNVGDLFWRTYLILLLPFQVIVPLVFVLIDFGATALISIAVWIVLIPISMIATFMMGKAMQKYLGANDERNKLINETLQGIRVVKFSGLEDVFIRRIEDKRNIQVRASVAMATWLYLSGSIIHNIPTAVNISVIFLLVTTRGITESEFAVFVMPNLGFLTLMTQVATRLPYNLQDVQMTVISARRIRDFLLLPEMKIEERAAPSDTSLAITIEGGEFKWGEAPEILLPDAEQNELDAKKKEEEKKLQQANVKTTSVEGPDLVVESQTVSPKQSDSPSPSPSPSSKKSRSTVLTDINLQIPTGSLTMVVGGVGSGKSSLAAAITGDIERSNGTVCLKGSIASCPQVAWITNSTVRGNIVFGMPFDEAKYADVIRVCAMEKDLQTLAAGDETAIGEKGVNLSGGQKARIQLARAVYSDRDIVVLDDPLSAVDAHVGRFLIDECILGRLKGKTVVLMTNQIQFLDRADKVVVLKDGKIVGDGKFAELKEGGINLDEFIIHKEKKDRKRKKETKSEDGAEATDKGQIETHVSASTNEDPRNDDTKQDSVTKDDKAEQIKTPEPTIAHQKDIENKPTTESIPIIASDNDNDSTDQSQSIPTPTPSTDPSLEDNEKAEKAARQMMTEEEQSTGVISLKTYFRFLATMMPAWLVPFAMLFGIVVKGIQLFQSYWLGVVPEPTLFYPITFIWKLGIYGFLTLLAILFLMLYSCAVGCSTYRSNRIIHQRLINHVMHCPVSFFDTTPLGRIINRFGGDIAQTDRNLVVLLYDVYLMVVGFVGQIVIVAISTPWFLAIGLPVLLLFGVVLVLYSRAARDLQRLDAISRSPVVSIFSEVINGAGLSTIRAFNQEGRWKKQFEEKVDDWTVRTLLYWEGKNWGSTYTSLVSMVYVAGVVILGWFFMTTPQLAVALTSSLTFNMLGIILVQQFVELDSQMTCFERINFYSTRLPQESTSSSISPPKEWPSVGNVNFENVTFRYRPGLPFVLRNVSFAVRGGETIGVCGRTGAGKSSLLFALFRLIELDPALSPLSIDVDTGLPIPADPNEEPNSGRVVIDDVDISKVQIQRVRRSIAIIPQDPTLFTGSVRYNLDIAGQCTDSRIWEVLEMVQMRSVVAEMSAGLDSEVAEGGSNFSVGQRQLLCFARAILNNCKIVVLDEATASVDVETDAKIQRTIREQFREQTVIVIAHRLNTIMDSDRILVMDNGTVAEFDTLENLKANQNSTFNGLLHSLTH